jgi:site-specific DNA recombinase
MWGSPDGGVGAAPAVRRAGCPARGSGPGWDAIVIGEYERAFYGSQYAAMAPLFEHYGVQLWMPEVGGRVDYASEHDEKTMTGLGLSSKREITRTRIRGPYRDGRPDPGAGPVPGRASTVRVPAG